MLKDHNTETKPKPITIKATSELPRPASSVAGQASLSLIWLHISEDVHLMMCLADVLLVLASF